MTSSFMDVRSESPDALTPLATYFATLAPRRTGTGRRPVLAAATSLPSCRRVPENRSDTSCPRYLPGTTLVVSPLISLMKDQSTS